MKTVEVSESALESLKAMVEQLQSERDELLGFAKEYLEAWDSGMAGDSYLRRIADSAIAKCTQTQ